MMYTSEKTKKLTKLHSLINNKIIELEGEISHLYSDEQIIRVELEASKKEDNTVSYIKAITDKFAE